MEIYFNSEYTFGLSLFCVITAGIFSFILYRKSKKDSPLSSVQINVLSLLRFFSVFLIMSLFLQLAIQRVKHSKQKPELILGIDNSQSLNKFQDEVLFLVDKLKKEFKEYEPEILLFDSQTQKNENITFDGKRSNYSEFLNEINQNYLPANIGAVLLLGDGIFNAGTDPVYASNSVTYPIYTVGIGDTTRHTDAAVRKVAVNQTAYLENSFPVEIDLGFVKTAGQIVNLTIQQNNQLVYSKAIRVQSDDYFFTENLSLKPEKEGILNYVVRLEEVNGEQNLANNIHEFSINVISEKQKILILAHGSHPDIAAITAALKDKNNYDFELLTSYKKDINFADYDLVIIHQLPDANQQYMALLEKLQQSRRPFLYILGDKTSVPRFNNLQTGIQIQTNNSFENVKASINNQFSLFRFDHSKMQGLEKLPPLLTPFGDVTTNPMLEIFAFQKIQSIDTDRPLMAFGKIDGQKRGFILGEGLWRWRIHSFLQDRSYQLFDDFVQKTINYLILKTNEDNFNIFYQTEYAEDASVIMQAELFNQSYELDNSPDVGMVILDENGQKYNAIFDKTNEKYQLDIGQLPAGKYSFKAQTKLGETEYTESGSFSVNKIQIELIETEANFQVLSQMANKTGGDFSLSKNIDELIIQLKESSNLQTKQIEQQIYREFLSMKWFFFLILFLLALEWFLRKFWGIY